MSPDPDNCKKIVKDARSVQYFFMGPTTMEESESMRLCCYNSTVTSEQLQQRFDVGGGIPRFLFKTSATLSSALHADSAVALLYQDQDKALLDLMLNPRRIDAGSLAHKFQHLWSLYHLVPDEPYTWYTIELCSANGRKLVLHQLLEKEIRDLWNLFNTTKVEDVHHGTLRGIRFEAYAHKKIMIDGIKGTAKLLTERTISSRFTRRVFVPKKSTRVDLPNNNLDVLSRYGTTVDIKSPMYLLPSLCNFPVIDSAYVGPNKVRIMFQMKAGMSKSKPLSEKAETICQALGDFFVVVVPADNIITKQLETKTSMKQSETKTSMKQYVLVLNESDVLAA